jgi:hypothetical protein
MASKPGVSHSPPGQAWRTPVYWPGGARRIGGVSLVCCSCTEREKASVDTDTAVHLGLFSHPVGKRERAEEQPKALSTDAAPAGGPAHSSCEAPASWGGGGAKEPAHHDLLL